MPSPLLEEYTINSTPLPPYSCFDGDRCIAAGALAEAALAYKHALEAQAAGPILIFDNHSGRSVDFDVRGTDEEALARLPDAEDEAAPPRGRGRPKLGVIAREVTLLPRHWEWLAAQPGGASIALRKLVEEARRADEGSPRRRQERAYHFILAMAGDLPGFEEASRALFAGDEAGFRARIAGWPQDIRRHALLLAYEAQ
ncbi:DUF2239 family protein [Azotobacter armeniacus]